MEIGPTDLGERPVFLVPMRGVADISFYLICKRSGVDTTHMELVSDDALTRSTNKTQQGLNVPGDECPVAIQIYGKDVASTVEAARICEEVRPDILDINSGYPVKGVAGKGAGADMLRSVPLMLEITGEVVKAMNTPITVKTRLGWDADNRVIVDPAEQLQDRGTAAFSIREHTRMQIYMGEADWTSTRVIRSSPHIQVPTIRNDDVTSAGVCRQRFKDYGVNAAMIGRVSIDHPWISREVEHYLMAGKLLLQGPFSWYLDILKKRVKQSVERLNERRGTLHIHRHLAATPLSEGTTDFKQARIAMLRAGTVNGLLKIMNDIPKKYGISE